jgi:hypothetical protein
MARKKAATPRGTEMTTATARKADVAPAKDIGYARIELPRRDFERLRRNAQARGLSISAYIRQAVLLTMRDDEAKGGGR